ncbi:MAG: ribonuclease PH [Anaerolineae bacterium]
MRIDGREPNALRPVTIEVGTLDFADGSVLVSFGKTRVLCAATIQESVPPWMVGRGSGWVTGEYAMLPASTQTRTPRETKGLSGRTQEIQRLVGRSLRASLNLQALGERMIIVDCDVLQADGGTRTASITGGYVVLRLALAKLLKAGLVTEDVLAPEVAAISAGVVDGAVLLDLCYEEDVAAEVDMNVVMNAAGEMIEVQGTAEHRPFSRARLDELLALSQQGIARLIELQRAALRG